MPGDMKPNALQRTLERVDELKEQVRDLQTYNTEQVNLRRAAQARCELLESLLRESQTYIGGDWRERRDAALAQAPEKRQVPLCRLCGGVNVAVPCPACGGVLEKAPQVQGRLGE
jgi:hypothetical protein